MLYTGQRRTNWPFALAFGVVGNLSERASANGIGRVIRQPIALDSLWMGTDPRQLDGR